jgi:cobalamin biosynthetic protein CobC
MLTYGTHDVNGIRHDDWLDLSTGINPEGYPVPPIPAAAWQRLPDDADGLAEQAARLFGCPHALPVSGSQAAIRALPTLLPRGRVALADLTYGEYAPAFEQAGHDVIRFAYGRENQVAGFADANAAAGGARGEFSVRVRDAERDDTGQTPAHVTGPSPAFILDGDTLLPDDIDYLVIVNPNNPTTDTFNADVLLRWRDTLAARGGCLVVDEAFIETMPAQSVAPACGAPGLIVLRSVGKFFGLAGLRVGFVLGEAAFLRRLEQMLGAWAVNGPARYVTQQAFADIAWQDQQRSSLSKRGSALQALLAAHHLPVRSAPLYSWFAHPNAIDIHVGLARQRIWTRLFETAVSSSGYLPSIRIGLPSGGEATSRLDTALKALSALAPHRE